MSKQNYVMWSHHYLMSEHYYVVMWFHHYIQGQFFSKEAMAPSKHDWKLVYQDVKHQTNQPNQFWCIWIFGSRTMCAYVCYVWEMEHIGLRMYGVHVYCFNAVSYEPRQENICPLGLRPGQTQNGLYSQVNAAYIDVLCMKIWQRSNA